MTGTHNVAPVRMLLTFILQGSRIVTVPEDNEARRMLRG